MAVHMTSRWQMGAEESRTLWYNSAGRDGVACVHAATALLKERTGREGPSELNDPPIVIGKKWTAEARGIRVNNEKSLKPREAVGTVCATVGNTDTAVKSATERRRAAEDLLLARKTKQPQSVFTECVVATQRDLLPARWSSPGSWVKFSGPDVSSRCGADSDNKKADDERLQGDCRCPPAFSWCDCWGELRSLLHNIFDKQMLCGRWHTNQMELRGSDPTSHWLPAARGEFAFSEARKHL